MLDHQLWGSKKKEDISLGFSDWLRKFEAIMDYVKIYIWFNIFRISYLLGYYFIDMILTMIFINFFVS